MEALCLPIVLKAAILRILIGPLVAAIAHIRVNSGCGWFTKGRLFGVSVLLVAVAIPRNK